MDDVWRYARIFPSPVSMNILHHNKVVLHMLTRSSASACNLVKFPLFWEVKRSWLVVFYWHFGIMYQSHHKGHKAIVDFLTLEDATETLSRNVNTLPAKAAQYPRRVKIFLSLSLSLVLSLSLYICIYMCVCVCVCVSFLRNFKDRRNENLGHIKIMHKKYRFKQQIFGVETKHG